MTIRQPTVRPEDLDAIMRMQALPEEAILRFLSAEGALAACPITESTARLRGASDDARHPAA